MGDPRLVWGYMSALSRQVCAGLRGCVQVVQVCFQWATWECSRAPEAEEG